MSVTDPVPDSDDVLARILLCGGTMKQKSNAAYHLVARTQGGATPFAQHSQCQKTWRRLQHAFPQAIAAVLMPNHVHIIVPGASTVETLPFRLAHCLPPGPWQPVPSPQPLSDLLAMKRAIRYIHLNPCRKEYSGDPISWEWSTHRDYLGVVAYPWPRTWTQLQSLGFYKGPTGVEAFHRYVSADPTAHVLGTPPPVNPVSLKPNVLRLDDVCRAAEMITRAPQGAFQKKGRKRAQLMRLLAGPLGIPAVKVAEHFGVNRSSSLAVTTDHQKRIDGLWLRPLLMTLHDPRLMYPTLPPGNPTNVAFRA